jgi:hypothetical protein
MTSTDTYNGWTNRETWALDLWIGNDQFLYKWALEAVQNANSAQGGDELADWQVGEIVKDWWEWITDIDSEVLPAETILPMVRDIGSEYRINWDEIGSHFHPRNFS